MLIGIFKLLLHLYPDSLRSTFGPEMTSVFAQKWAEAGRDGAVRRAALALREISALICDAFRAQMESVPSSGEPWIWSMEAPAAAILLYSFWVWRLEESGIWGFFFPGTYVLVTALGALSAWIIGREFTLLRRRHAWRRVAIVFAVLGFALPMTVLGVESAWAKYLLARDAAFTFHLPGIQVAVTAGRPDLARKGLTFSRILTQPGGTRMVMLQHTGDSTPPYLFFGALAAGALALKSRRTAHPGPTEI